MEEITGKETMTSLEIAEATGMRHADVLRSIRNMEEAWVKVSERNFALSSYKQPQPNGGCKDIPCYILSKTECLYVATKFNDEARAKLVLRWEELENQARKSEIVMPNFSNPAEAARAWADQYELRLKLEAKAREDAPKVEFYDTTAKSDDTFDLDNVSKTLNYKNIGRNNLFKILKEQKVLMRNRNPYQKYVDCGYFKIIQQPFDRGGKPGINSKTVVYQKGVDFIKKLLDRLGYKRAFCKNTEIQTSLKFD